MGVNIRYHLDLCMTGIALNGFHIAAVQLQLVSDTGMSETMENHFRQSLLLNQLIESTVDNLPLNRLAVGRTENQIEVYELVTEKVFQFFDVSLSLYQHFIETVDKLVRKYHTRDPYELCQLLGIKIHYYDLQKKLKGFFYYQSRQKNIVIDHNVNGILERILVAHELGHAVLHTKIAMMHGFQEMEVFDDRSSEENEANFFAAELLLEDEEVLECLSEHTFFETAKMLYVPAALLDYKFSLLHEKGELVNSMYIRKADFLKGDLHAYDNDIDYGDI